MLGKKIRELREENNITQQDLAKYLKVAKSTLSQYETGSRIPNDDIKKAIALKFNVSIDYLLGLTNIPNTIDDYIQKSNTNSYHINDDEQTLIKKYRQLKAEDKQIIDTMLERFVPTKEPKSDEKAI
ncbi:helix-turn-helix domain-containing protein [Megamonas funiformis]|uniref:helix-turn-helix domain-containing protein n=1 Tax=Megamonas funiformis TaxID=437897 RepID=UPI00389043BF